MLFEPRNSLVVDLTGDLIRDEVSEMQEVEKVRVEGRVWSCCYPCEGCGTKEKVDDVAFTLTMAIAGSGAVIGIVGMFFNNAPTMVLGGVIIFLAMITAVALLKINSCRPSPQE